jgi:hypothetical protein
LGTKEVESRTVGNKTQEPLSKLREPDAKRLVCVCVCVITLQLKRGLRNDENYDQDCVWGVGRPIDWNVKWLGSQEEETSGTESSAHRGWEKKLMEGYAGMLAELKAELTKAIPTVDEGKKAL